jgi:hypothetical protein
MKKRAWEAREHGGEEEEQEKHNSCMPMKKRVVLGTLVVVSADEGERGAGQGVAL